MDFDCPQCGSHNTASYEMAYTSGTHSGYASGTGIDFDGNIGAGGGRFSMKSGLAEQTAPPVRPTLGCLVPTFLAFGLVMLLIFTVPILSRIFQISDRVIIYLIPGLFIVLYPLSLFYFNRDLKRSSLPRYYDQLMQWQSSWICRRCGYRWFWS